MKLFFKNLKIPSGNHRLDEKIYKIRGRNRIYKEKTSEYQIFEQIIKQACIDSKMKKISKPTHKNKSCRNVSMGLTIFFKKGGRSDIDGNQKCLQDALNGYAYDDDRQIKRYHRLEIEDYSGIEGFEVEILEIKENS